MSIEERIAADLKEAMRSRDQKVVDALRMAKAKIVERQKAPGFKGPMTDAVAAEAITAYVKSLKKAIEEIEAGGGGQNPIVEKYRFECDFLARYLPKTMTEEETRTLVRTTIAELGVSGPAAVGRVMGAIMKAHKGDVDATLVRRMVEEELAKSP